MHGTTGEPPRGRFDRDEAKALRPLGGTPPFTTARDLVRSVGADCVVAVDGNSYSVPWRLIGERVRVTVSRDVVRAHHGGREVVVHAEMKGRHGRAVDDAHLAGLAGTGERPLPIVVPEALRESPPASPLASLTRRVRSRRRKGLLMDTSDHLTTLLGRLKLAALRDQLDSLIDEAGRRELTIREDGRHGGQFLVTPGGQLQMSLDSRRLD